MSKRALKTYLTGLRKKDLEAQVVELYEKFPAVKAYYDFVFNPKEDKLLQEAKTKISNEYFPVKRKRPKARRSVAQNYIKHFIKLGMESALVADVMCFNLEIAQTFEKERNLPDAFYKSMLNSFTIMTAYISQHGLLGEFKDRIITIYGHVNAESWPYREKFSQALDVID